jgi:hypothetical protein
MFETNKRNISNADTIPPRPPPSLSNNNADNAGFPLTLTELLPARLVVGYAF